MTSSAPVTNGLGNRITASVLRSRLHPILSRWLCLITYTGRRSGRRFRLPTQYVRHDGQIIVFVGKPDTKKWWRNFRHQPQPVEVVLDGVENAAMAEAVIGKDQPVEAAELLAAFLARYPKVERMIDGATPSERAEHVVFVRLKVG